MLFTQVYQHTALLTNFPGHGGKQVALVCGLTNINLKPNFNSNMEFDYCQNSLMGSGPPELPTIHTGLDLYIRLHHQLHWDNREIGKINVKMLLSLCLVKLAIKSPAPTVNCTFSVFLSKLCPLQKWIHFCRPFSCRRRDCSRCASPAVAAPALLSKAGPRYDSLIHDLREQWGHPVQAVRGKREEEGGVAAGRASWMQKWQAGRA